MCDRVSESQSINQSSCWYNQKSLYDKQMLQYSTNKNMYINPCVCSNSGGVECSGLPGGQALVNIDSYLSGRGNVLSKCDNKGSLIKNISDVPLRIPRRGSQSTKITHPIQGFRELQSNRFISLPYSMSFKRKIPRNTQLEARDEYKEIDPKIFGSKSRRIKQPKIRYE